MDAMQSDATLRRRIPYYKEVLVVVDEFDSRWQELPDFFPAFADEGAKARFEFFDERHEQCLSAMS